MSSVEVATVYGFNEVSDQVVEQVLKWLSPVEQLASTRVNKRFNGAALKHVTHLDLEPVPVSNMLGVMMKIPRLTSINFAGCRKRFHLLSGVHMTNELSPVVVALAGVNPNLKRIIGAPQTVICDYLITVMSGDDKYNVSNFKTLLGPSTVDELGHRHPGHKFRYQETYSHDRRLSKNGVLVKYTIGNPFSTLRGIVFDFDTCFNHLQERKGTIEILQVTQQISVTGMGMILDLLPSFPSLKDIVIGSWDSPNYDYRLLDKVLMIPTLKNVSHQIVVEDYPAIYELFLNCPRNDFHSFCLIIMVKTEGFWSYSHTERFNIGTCRDKHFSNSFGVDWQFRLFVQKFSPSKYRVFKFKKMSDLVEAATHCLPLMKDKPNYKFMLVFQPPTSNRGANENMLIHPRDIPSFLETPISVLPWQQSINDRVVSNLN